MPELLADIQINVYAEKTAKIIAEKLKKYEPTVEDWIGVDFEWPSHPECSIFFKGLLTEVLPIISNYNASLYVNETQIIRAQLPETIEQHCAWCELPTEEYQEVFIKRKFHPRAEKLCCKSCHVTWFSLPEVYYHARRVCYSCEKEIGVRVV
jgi:hypothetical protein